MESYINYVPGPIGVRSESLQKEIERCFSDKNIIKSSAIDAKLSSSL